MDRLMTTQIKPFRFTNNAIGELPNQKKQIIYKDTKLTHLGLLVGVRSKSFFIQAHAQGRPIRHSIGKFPYLSVEGARKKGMAVLAKIFNGENPNTTRKAERELLKFTLADALDLYIKTHNGLKERTARDYRGTVKRYFGDWLNKPLLWITPELVMKRHAKLGECIGNSTANGALRVIRAVYNFAKAMQPELPDNPVARLSQTRAWYKETRRTRIIESKDLKSWWQATEALQNRDFTDYFQFMLLTGLRKSEGLRLRWENVDLKGKKFTIIETKNGDPLTLPLSDYLVTLLSSRVRSSEWVFTGFGSSGHLVEPKKAVKQVCEISEVEFTMHDLRRTFLTIAESLDIPAYALKRLVNHRISDVTAGYIQITVERLRKPMQKITEYVMSHIHDEKKVSSLRISK
jgi:integrase